jgi:hypothetical protein
MFSDLYHLDGSLRTELKKEAVFRIPPERKGYFDAMPWTRKMRAFIISCLCDDHLPVGTLARNSDLGREGVQPAFEQLPALDQIGKHLGTKIPSAERDFYKQVNSQFGWLKGCLP